MTIARAAWLLVWACAAATAAACTGSYSSDFQVAVVNRTVNSISVLANGNSIGQVTAGQTSSFSISLQETNTNVFTNGVAPTPQADVVLSAKDLKTGAVSATKNLTLTASSPTYVTFSSSDFPQTVATVARMTVSPTNPGINQDVFFNGSSSTVSNGTYLWDFGDGQTGTGVTTQHQYTRAGTYTVQLTVTSDAGQTSNVSRTLTVSENLPVTAATFTFSPTAPAINQDVLFSVMANAAGQTYFWDYGDGGSGSGASSTHRFTRAGTFTVTLRVSNAAGQSATSSRAVPVSANLPAGSVSFSLSPTSPGVSDDVFFNASASTVTNANYSWDFGDGTGGTGVRPTHQYNRAGTYTVTLTVTNDLGQSASTSRTITVSAVSTVITADFSFSPTDPSITRGTNGVIFDAAPSSSGVAAWAWDFGDGTTATGQKTTHTFTRAGTWVVRLTVTDSVGRTATTTKQVPVTQ